MRAKIFLDHILLNLDIKTQITCNYHTERARAKRDLAYNAYILCSRCRNVQYRN
jgi:hypothetical protein